MGDELTYLDLLVLRKIDAESTVEKFGSSINTSFFETANVLGSMKIKGLVDIQSSIGGQSPLVLTGTGQDTLATATQKATEPLDALDNAILKAIGAGARELGALQGQLNIRSPDLAFHLHKLKSQDYIDSEVRSAKVSLSLSEKGFIAAGGASWRPPTASASAHGAPASPVASSGSAATGASPLSGSASSPASAPAPAPSLFASAPKDIQDILTGWTRPASSAPAAKPASKPTPASDPKQTTLSPTGPNASSGAPVPSPAAFKPVSAPSSKPGASAPSANPTTSARPSAPAAPAEPFDPAKMDKTAMMVSKLEHYVKTYLPYALLLLLLLILLAYAIHLGMQPSPSS